MADQITWTTLDGRLGGDFATDLHFCLADRIAFERRFGMPTTELSRKLREEPTTVPEEWLAFLAWRCIAREHPELAPNGDADFSSWLVTVAELRVRGIRPDGTIGGEPDPTAPAPSPSDSPASGGSVAEPAPALG